MKWQDASSCTHLQRRLVLGKDALADSVSGEHTWEEVSSFTAEVKSCPMFCCGRIFSLRDVKKYFLLFPIRGAGKFQHEAIKR